MIYPFDFHNHTTYCDGKNTIEEMVISAIEKGMKAIGFSSHSYTNFDKSYCITEENTEKYIQEINNLKEKYHSKIDIYCGIEYDYFSKIPTDNFDYVIGSVHYVKQGEKYLDVDLSKEDFIESVNKYFGGDYYTFCEEYYECVANLFDKTKCDIIGHIDLVTKFNENGELFDETDERYTRAALSAVDKLLENNVVFEVNTGAISRGYKTTPYPAKFILEHICKKGGNIILSSDSHTKENLCFDFESTVEYIKSIGFKTVKTLADGKFKQITL